MLGDNAVEKLLGKTVFEIQLVLNIFLMQFIQQAILPCLFLSWENNIFQHLTLEARILLSLKDIVNTEFFLEIDLPSCANHNGNPLFHVREILSILKVQPTIISI